MQSALLPIAIGALLGKTTNKKAGKEQFQAVKGRKKKDGTTGKAYIRKKAKRNSVRTLASVGGTLLRVLETSNMIQLPVRRSELTYEVALSPLMSVLIDTPGRVASAFLLSFDRHGLTLSDLTIDDGLLEETGLSFELPKLYATVSIRADRFEIRFASMDATADQAQEILRGIWQAFASVSPEAQTTSHSLLFEIDCEPPESYRSILERFCPSCPSLPDGTAAAVVYYLPEDRSHGFQPRINRLATPRFCNLSGSTERKVASHRRKRKESGLQSLAANIPPHSLVRSGAPRLRMRPDVQLEGVREQEWLSRN